MPRNLRFVPGLAAALALGLGFAAPPPPGGHFWEPWPFFEAAFGFGGCLLIVFFSKALGRLFIRKKEDYYGD